MKEFIQHIVTGMNDDNNAPIKVLKSMCIPTTYKD